MTGRFDDGVIDFSQFKKNKAEQEGTISTPFFSQAQLITLGNSEEDQNTKYILLANIVQKGKQIIALESTGEDDAGEVAIVEAIIENDQFTGVEAISNEEDYEEYVALFLQIFKEQAEQEIDTVITEDDGGEVIYEQFEATAAPRDTEDQDGGSAEGEDSGGDTD